MTVKRRLDNLDQEIEAQRLTAWNAFTRQFSDDDLELIIDNTAPDDLKRRWAGVLELHPPRDVIDFTLARYETEGDQEAIKALKGQYGVK